MSEEQTEETTTEFTFDDSVIVMIRELLQLSLLTGTNFVDHVRGLRLVEHEGSTRLVPAPEYVKQYNDMVQAISKDLESKMEEMQKNIAE